MRVAFLMPGAAREHPLWSPVGRRLEERGARVEFLFCEAGVTALGRIRVEHDLYVLKSGAPLGLSVGGALHAAGAALLNPYPVAAMCRDKLITSHVLRAAGVPTPETWATTGPDPLHALLDGGPLVVKPNRGSRGVGVRVVRSGADIDALPADHEPWIVQRYHPPDGDGLDRKMYCVGGRVFGVERIWPARTLAQKLGRPFAPTQELVDIALRCAEAIGVDTFGFDVVLSDGRPYVVDLSSWPGFKGVPDAEERLAAVIELAARRALAGEPVTTGVLS
jgi:ribosomal protein S6--L-glutamate ligase